MVPCSELLPAEFRIAHSSEWCEQSCKDNSLLFFEMKSRAHRVNHAIQQLRTRFALLQEKEVRSGVRLLAVVALSRSDCSAFEALQETCRVNPDIDVVVVDPDELSPCESIDSSIASVPCLAIEDANDSAEILSQDVFKALQDGPLHLNRIASGLGFAKRYNHIFHGGKRVNDGSFTAWLQTLPGVRVERDGRIFKPTSQVHLVERRQGAPIKTQLDSSSELSSTPTTRGRCRERVKEPSDLPCDGSSPCDKAAPSRRWRLGSPTPQQRLTPNKMASSAVHVIGTHDAPCTKPSNVPGGKHELALIESKFSTEACSKSKPKKSGKNKKPLDAYFAKKIEEEDREMLDDTTFFGTIVVYFDGRGFGYVQPNDVELLPELVREEVMRDKKNSLYFRSPDLAMGYKPEKGDAVSFNVYTDNHSAGACNIAVGKHWRPKSDSIDP